MKYFSRLLIDKTLGLHLAILSPRPMTVSGAEIAHTVQGAEQQLSI